MLSFFTPQSTHRNTVSSIPWICFCPKCPRCISIWFEKITAHNYSPFTFLVFFLFLFCKAEITNSGYTLKLSEWFFKNSSIWVPPPIFYYNLWEFCEGISVFQKSALPPIWLQGWDLCKRILPPSRVCTINSSNLKPPSKVDYLGLVSTCFRLKGTLKQRCHFAT